VKFELRFADLLSGNNYGTHKSRKVKAWLAKNPPFSTPLHPGQFFVAESGDRKAYSSR